MYTKLSNKQKTIADIICFVILSVIIVMGSVLGDLLCCGAIFVPVWFALLYLTIADFKQCRK